MDAIDIDTHARRLHEEYGSKAMLIAAQRARAAEERKDQEQARLWRRIEAVLSAKRGAPES